MFLPIDRMMRLWPALFVVYISLTYATLALKPDTIYHVAVSELGYFQTLGAVAFLCAGVLFGVAYARTRQPACVVLAVAFVFAAGEELSWGQHLLGFGSPEFVKDLNAQDEVTLHNLTVFQESPVLSFEILFLVFGFAFAVAVPLVARVFAARRLLGKFVPLAPAALATAFLVNYVAAKVAEGLSPWHHAAVEIRESNFALVFAGIALHAATTQWREDASRSEPEDAARNVPHPAADQRGHGGPSDGRVLPKVWRPVRRRARERTRSDPGW